MPAPYRNLESEVGFQASCWISWIPARDHYLQIEKMQLLGHTRAGGRPQVVLLNEQWGCNANLCHVKVCSVVGEIYTPKPLLLKPRDQIRSGKLAEKKNFLQWTCL